MQTRVTNPTLFNTNGGGINVGTKSGFKNKRAVARMANTTAHGTDVINVIKKYF